MDGDRRVQLGCCPQLTDRSVSALEIADALVERGYTAMYLNEHPHIPVHAPRTRYPGEGELPDRYRRFLDPFVTLAFVAARTDLEIGTAVSLVGEHDVIALAKEIATLDMLSGGRLVCGVGFGWHREEFEAHGFSSRVRGKVVLETVAALKTLWTEEQASFDGEFVKFGPCWSYPKPLQKPHVPLFLGAPTRPANLDRVARLFDGFMPMTPPLRSNEFETMLEELSRRCEAAGRDPASVRLMTNERPPLDGRWEDVFATAGRLGLERVNVLIPPAAGPDVLERDVALRLLDDAAAAYARVTG